MGTPPKGEASYYSVGDFNAVCSMCGHTRKASTLVKNWQGLYRCPDHNESRQPQDFVRGIKDDMSVPWTQVRGITFVTFCTLNSQAAIPDIGLPTCMIPDNLHYDPNGL